jgi:hypothetical protein
VLALALELLAPSELLELLALLELLELLALLELLETFEPLEEEFCKSVALSSKRPCKPQEVVNNIAAIITAMIKGLTGFLKSVFIDFLLWF